MNRIIKFRIWDKEYKRIVNWHDDKESIVDAFPLDAGDEWTENCEVMQFTGVLDKKGVEIYEGDIVYCREGWMYGEMNLEIKWDDKGCRWMAYNKKGNIKWDLSKQFGRELKVIGNIFENSELLNKIKYHSGACV